MPRRVRAVLVTKGHSTQQAGGFNDMADECIDYTVHYVVNNV